MCSLVCHVPRAILVLLLLTGCAGVRFVAPYDAQFDRMLSALHEDTGAFLVKMRRTRGGHDANASFYDVAHARVDALRLRAELYGEDLNRGTLENLARLAAAFDDLEAGHREGPLTSRAWSRTLEQHFRALLQIELHKKHSLLIDPPVEEMP